MNGKPRPNRARYIEIVRRVTPEWRLKKAFELSEFAKALFLQAIRNRNPGANEDEIDRMYIEGLLKCHKSYLGGSDERRKRLIRQARRRPRGRCAASRHTSRLPCRNATV